MTGLSPHDRRDARLLRLTALCVEEAEKVLSLLPIVQDLQWERARRPEGAPTGRRSQGGHADPTADSATDSGRLYVRSVIDRSAPLLVATATTLGGVRRGLEKALARWEGIPDDGDDLDPTPGSE